MLLEGLRIMGEEVERRSRVGRERCEERVQSVRGVWTGMDGWRRRERVQLKGH